MGRRGIVVLSAACLCAGSVVGAADPALAGEGGRGKPSSAAATAVDPARVATAVVRLTNDFRRREGREDLGPDPHLAAAAQAFAQYMARTGDYGHEADGRTPSQRAEAQGYDYCIVAENIGYRYRSTGFTTDALAQALVQGWENSPPHRHNMLDRDVADIGVGVAHSGKTGRWYGVQLFGLPQSASRTFRVTNNAGVAVTYRLGDRAFELAPRVTRTHERCRPAEITFDPPNGDARTVAPRAGEHYLVERGASGTLQLRKE